MYFDDFRKLLRRHQSPQARLDFLYSRWGPSDVVSMVDFHLPKRHGVVTTGWSEQDWHRDSFVCNVGFLDGEVPMIGWGGVFREQRTPFDPTPGFTKRPCRGWKQAVQILLRQGVIIPSRELDIILGGDSRAQATNENRIHYLR
jgi:hypothetical protein